MSVPGSRAILNLAGQGRGPAGRKQPEGSWRERGPGTGF